MKRFGYILGILGFGMIAACSPQIEMQSIPVSSNPMGANVYADGNLTCQTPCKVDLAKTSEHIITIKKKGFKQFDIIINRKYQQEKVLLNAVSRGVGTSDSAYGGSTAWGIMNGISSIDSQESTGDAYVLTPSAVSVKLETENSAAQDSLEHKSSSKDDNRVQTAEPSQMETKTLLKDAVEATAIGVAPTIKGGVTGKSGSTHENFNSDGSYTKTSTKTSVKAGVKINPAEAVEALDSLLEGDSK